MTVKTIQKNKYELTLILKPDLSEDALKKVLSQVESSVKNFGGEILSVAEPQLKRFTHKIKNVKDGFYVTILFNSPPDLPNTLKKSLLVIDEILRFVLIGKEE